MPSLDASEGGAGDGGELQEGGGLDAGIEDGSTGGPSTDGGLFDGGVPEGGAVFGPDAGNACGLGPQDLFTVASSGVWTTDAPALAVHDDGALVAWIEAVGGTPRLSTRYIPVEGRQTQGMDVAGQEGEQHDPSIVRTSQGFVVVWRDDRGGDFDLKTRLVQADGTPVGSVHDVTDNAQDDQVPAAGRNSEGQIVLAWIRKGAEGAQGRVRLLDTDGSTMGSAHSVDSLGNAAGKPAVVTLDSGAAVGWVDETSGVVSLRALSVDGSPQGSTRQLSQSSAATGPVDLSESAGGGGAALFDVRLGGSRFDVRFRRFDASGEATGNERSIVTSQTSSGVASSLAPFREGHFAAYEASSDAEDTSALRVALLSEDGEPIASKDLQRTNPPPTFSVIRVSPNQRRAFVAWTDQTRALVARLRCN